MALNAKLVGGGLIGAAAGFILFDYFIPGVYFQPDFNYDSLVCRSNQDQPTNDRERRVHHTENRESVPEAPRQLGMRLVVEEALDARCCG